MAELYQERRGVFQVMVGADFTRTVLEALDASLVRGGKLIRFDFNGVKVRIKTDSELELIERDFRRATQGCIPKKIGPYPNAELSAEETARDQLIEARNKKRWDREYAKMQREAKSKRRRVEKMLAGSPDIEVLDSEAWSEYRRKNDGKYGNAVIDFAVRWARLMQMELAAGKNLEEIAFETSHTANLEDITGFMYGQGVSVLCQYWVHEENLRRWHNLRTQIEDEGELANQRGTVLNPALLQVVVRS